jgi:hypothetical protein
MDRKGEYFLSCDIDCCGAKVNKLLNVFSGSIDGCGYAINNLVLTESDLISDSQPISLFHELNRAKIRNIKFNNLTIYIPNTVYDLRVAVLSVDAGESIFENIDIQLLTNIKDKVPLIYDSYNCIYNNINLTDNMLIAKYK